MANSFKTLTWKNLKLLKKRYLVIGQAMVLVSLCLFIAGEKVDPESIITLERIQNKYSGNSINKTLEYDMERIAEKYTIYIMNPCKGNKRLNAIINKIVTPDRLLTSIRSINHVFANLTLKVDAVVSLDEITCKYESLPTTSSSIKYTIVWPEVPLELSKEDIFSIRKMNHSNLVPPQISMLLNSNDIPSPADMTTLQQLIDNYFINQIIIDDNFTSKYDVYPLGEDYKSVHISSNLYNICSMLQTITMIFCAINSEIITRDKSSRLKEMLNSIGVTRSQQWISWVSLLFTINFGVILLIFNYLGQFKVEQTFPRYLEHVDFNILVFVYSLSVLGNLSVSCFIGAFFSNEFVSLAVCIMVMSLRHVYGKLIGVHVSLPWSIVASLYPGYSEVAFVEILQRSILTGRKVTLGNMGEPLMPGFTFTVVDLIVNLVLDIMGYAALAVYVDNVWPGDYGIALPLDYPILYFGKKYLNWEDNNSEVSFYIESENIDRASVYEPVHESLKVGIEIKNLTHAYPGSYSRSVNNLSLTLYEDQITVLLGHNGAGKTSTMFNMTGFLKPTSGDIIVKGLSVQSDLLEIRQTMSLCPQQDVLMGELTVYEHLVFMNKLRDQNNMDTMNQLLSDMRMTQQKDVQAKKLSGGQMRKLSILQALIYGSQVVILDEPTSGIDTESRQLIWKIIKKHCKGRTVLMSTHYMDEAEYLGDRIVVMAAGNVIACGSPLYLKNKYGTGYKLTFLKHKDANSKAIIDLVKSHIQETILISDIGAELILELGHILDDRFSVLFNDLDREQERLQIDSYGVSIASLEDVFIRLHNQHLQRETILNNAEENYKSDASQVNSSAVVSGMQHQQLDSAHNRQLDSAQNRQLDSAQRTSPACWRDQLALLLQAKAILYAKSPFWLMAMMAAIAMGWYVGSMCLPPSKENTEYGVVKISSSFYEKADVDLNYGLIFDESSPGSKALVQKFRRYLTSKSLELTVFKYSGNFTTGEIEFFLSNQNGYSNILHHHVCIFILTPDLHWSALYSPEVLYSQQVASSMMSNLRQMTHLPNSEMSDVFLHNLYTGEMVHKPLIDKLRPYRLELISMYLNCGIYLAFTMLLFTVYKDTTSGCKQVQIICGMKIWVYWLSNLIFDFGITFILNIVLTSILASYGSTLLKGNQFFAFYVATYACTVACLSQLYVASFVFGNIGRLCCWCFLLFALLGTTLISIDRTTAHLPTVQWIFQLLRHIFSLANYNNVNRDLTKFDILNEKCEGYKCNLKEMKPVAPHCMYNYTNPGLTSELMSCGHSSLWYQLGLQYGIGEFLIGCVISFAVYSILILMYEYNYIPIPWNLNPGTEQMNADTEVITEKMKVQDMTDDEIKDYAIVLRGLTKDYGGDRVVVNKVYLRVPKGQLFGLLGVNGAGKSTMFGMMTGSTSISGGDAFVNGYDIQTQSHKAFENLRYCPQTNNLLDHMTCFQTLEFHAKLRGVKDSEIREKEISRLLSSLQLMKFKNMNTSKLSGGNRRKLCMAVALIGDPETVFLDEPTCGLDPFARREAWKTMEQFVKTGKTIILTSHSMEECESLCQRLVIMVSGRFMCLGSPHYLKKRFGNSYILKIQLAHDYTQQSKHRLLDFLLNQIQGSTLDSEYGASLSFTMPKVSTSWSSLFQLMQRIQNDNEMKVQYFSLTQTSLEKIFNSFAKKQ